MGMKSEDKLKLLAQITQMLLDPDVEIYEERGMQRSGYDPAWDTPDGRTVVRLTVPNLRKTLGGER